MRQSWLLAHGPPAPHPHGWPAEPTATGRQALLRNRSHATQSPVALGQVGNCAVTGPLPEQHWAWFDDDGGGHMLTLQRPVSWHTLPTPSHRVHWLPALPHSSARPVSQTVFDEQHPRQPDEVSHAQRPLEPCP